jgi:hypothetical protein
VRSAAWKFAAVMQKTATAVTKRSAQLATSNTFVKKKAAEETEPLDRCGTRFDLGRQRSSES